MWDCESPTLTYGGYCGPIAPLSTTTATTNNSNNNTISDGAQFQVIHNEVYASTANSLANFCTNITETDDALKQVRGGGFLAEFERDDEVDEEMEDVEEQPESFIIGGDGSPKESERTRKFEAQSRMHGLLGDNSVEGLLNGKKTKLVWVSCDHFNSVSYQSEYIF